MINIKTFKILMLILVALTVYCPPTYVFANSSSYYDVDGVTILPIENKSIVMKKEIVQIRPDLKDKEKRRWSAECEFTFYNQNNSEESVTMGYPDWLDYDFILYLQQDIVNQKLKKAISEYIDAYSKANKLEIRWNSDFSFSYFKGYQEGKLPYVKYAWKVHGLKVSVNNKRVKTSHRPLDMKIKIEKIYEKDFAIPSQEPLGAFIWQVSFKPGETKTVKVIFNFSGLSDIGGYQELSYILKTGALWADKIGEADIYWNYNGRYIDRDRIFPRNFKIKKNVIHWHFEDFEPTADISIFATYGTE